MDAAQTIRHALVSALGKLGVAMPQPVLEFPTELAHGDFATNAALSYGKQLGKNPRAFADEIAAQLGNIEGVARIEIAGPGFINFHLAPDYMAKKMRVVLDSPLEWGKNDVHAGKKILIEHSSPNLFKPFHIGHLVNNAVGEALVRLMRNAGADVTAVSYPSDVSPGIAKAVWALRDASDMGPAALGAAYAAGVKAYEEDDAAQKEIDVINAELYNKTPGRYWDIYAKGRDVSIEYFKKMTALLGSAFDGFIFESESESVGKEVVRAYTPKVFEESDGAIIFRGSRYGLFDNVFINSAGFATYLGKDIGLLKIKFERFVFDRSITVTDIEQKQHFELVKKAAEMITPMWSEKSLFLYHGRLQFQGGKISSRFGNVPLVEDLLLTVVGNVRARVAERLEGGAVEETAQKIGIAALKYTILRSSLGSNMLFDFEQAVSTEGDSGPYLQYTHARIRAVIGRGQEQGVRPLVGASAESSALERLLVRFPEITARAVREYAPHHVAQYLTELSSEFNAWYAREQILDGTPDAGRKLAIVTAVAVTLNRGLTLLGIDALDKM